MVIVGAESDEGDNWSRPAPPPPEPPLVAVPALGTRADREDMAMTRDRSGHVGVKFGQGLPVAPRIA